MYSTEHVVAKLITENDNLKTEIQNIRTSTSVSVVCYLKK